MLLVELPLTDYGESLEIQRRLVRRRILGEGPDVLLLLEHFPTVTLGKRAGHQDLLASPELLVARGVALHSADRGGGATYHGPGQIVGYPIIHLRSHRLSARDYVRTLEEAIIRTLSAFGVAGHRLPKMPGVWTGSCEKIASIGVKISQGVTFHGFSVNVNMAERPDELIILCGMPRARMMNMAELLGKTVEKGEVRQALVASLGEVFRVEIRKSSLQEAIGKYEP